MKNQKTELTISIKEETGHTEIIANGSTADLENYLINAVDGILDVVDSLKMPPIIPQKVQRQAFKMALLRHYIEKSGIDLDEFVEANKQLDESVAQEKAAKQEKEDKKKEDKKSVEKELEELFEQIKASLFGDKDEED